MLKLEIKSNLVNFVRRTKAGRRFVEQGVLLKSKIRSLPHFLKNKKVNIKDNILFGNLKKIDFSGKKEDVDCAVIVHLYYLESWEDIKKAISRINAFDLVVTIPKKNKEFIPTILKVNSNAKIIIVPNRGRDVLSFVALAPILKKAGYNYVLKIHSKKSTHRTDGSVWLNDMLKKLIPDNEGLENIKTLIKKQDSAIIGPAGHYISLKVNFEPNRHYLLYSLKKYYGKAKAEKIIKNKNSYGFFAGTMFWANLNNLKTITSTGYTPRHFDIEKGQIDATLAHALERLFCVVPEIELKKIYEIDEGIIKEVKYKTNNVPDWSDVYIGQQSLK